MITEDSAYYEGIEAFHAKASPINPYRRVYAVKPETILRYAKLADKWDEGFIFASNLKKEKSNG